MNWIYDPWPWYISGPMIACIMLLLIMVGKNFGMSSNLRTMCTICGAGNSSDFFKFDLKAQRWNLVVVVGTIIGGYIGANFLSNDLSVSINPKTIQDLQDLGFATAGTSYLPSELFEIEEIKNIFTALGVTIGTEEDPRALNLSKLRYHKVVIMCDADIDGSHIATLILTFFFRYMKELIENGHIYIATPPLYLVKRGAKKQYAWSDNERDEIMAQFGDGSKIQRYKGLGEMNASQLWDTTMNPEFRTMRLVQIDNGTEADRIFSMLMGDEVPPRREFIEKNAIYANIDA